MSKLTLQNLIVDKKVEAGRLRLTKDFFLLLKTSKIIKIFIVQVFFLVMMLGFFSNAHSINSNFNATSREQTNNYFALRTTGYELGYSEGISDSCVYSWTAQTSGTTSVLNSVSTVSDQIAWAAGDGPTIRKTTNGGTSWTNATGTGITGDVYGLYAWNENIAFCTTTPVFGSTPSFIYRTSNAGTTWIQVYATAVDGFIDAIQMISASEGYAVGDPLNGVWTLLKTTNAGINWVQMPSAPTQISSETGYNNSLQILGNDIWFGTNSTRVYHSTNLGITWTSGATTGTTDSYAVHYNNSLTGLTGGSAMLLSTNGGSSYSSVASPGITGRINGIEGAGTDWWAIRSGSVIYYSTNQGDTWTNAYNLSGAVFNDIDFSNAASCPTGWSVGNSGVIVKMTGLIVGVTNYEGEVPGSYLLNQNYPNPFNPSTNINFSLPKAGLVSLKIYDTEGREVTTLVNEFKNAGNYVVGFNASKLTSGTYFYRIESNDFVATKKMLLIK